MLASWSNDYTSKSQSHSVFSGAVSWRPEPKVGNIQARLRLIIEYNLIMDYTSINDHGVY